MISEEANPVINNIPSRDSVCIVYSKVPIRTCVIMVEVMDGPWLEEDGPGVALPLGLWEYCEVAAEAGLWGSTSQQQLLFSVL